MQKRPHDDPSRPRRVLVLCALALSLLLVAGVPATASAQDPAGDQYAPSTPTGGNDNGSPPVPTSGSGHDNVNDTSGDSSSSPTATQSSSTDPSSSATTPSGTTSTAGSDGGNKAQRTLDQLAATADQQRQQRADANGTGAAGGDQTTESLSSQQSSGSGMGTFLLIALGLTLLWAIAAGIVNFRRRAAGAPDEGADQRRREPTREDGHPA